MALKQTLFAAAAISLAGVTSAHAALAYGLTDDNSLIGFDTAAPSVGLSAVPIKLINNTATQDLIGIDYRPSNGLLYGVGKFGTIYTINPLTGIATPGANLSVSLSGSRFGLDFNPVANLLRITSDADQSLAVNVDSGVTTVNGTINPGNPNVVASAYTNNVAGAASTVLYAIDSSTDSLYTQVPATGALTLVGSLGGINVSAISGFDITTVAGTNTGYAVLQQVGNGSSEFYTINLLTGQATSTGIVGGGDVFDGLAVTVPEPVSLAAIAGGLIVAGVRRRRD